MLNVFDRFIEYFYDFNIDLLFDGLYEYYFHSFKIILEFLRMGDIIRDRDLDKQLD